MQINWLNFSVFMKYNFCKFQMYFIETADIIYVNVLFETYFIHSFMQKRKRQILLSKVKKCNNRWALHSRRHVAVGFTHQFEPYLNFYCKWIANLSIFLHFDGIWDLPKIIPLSYFCYAIFLNWQYWLI